MFQRFTRRVIFLETLLFSASGSLFFSEQEIATDQPISHLKTKRKKTNWVLNGVLRRSDKNSWIIWINNKRLTSDHPFFEGWRIVQVLDTQVTLISGGQKKVLSLA